MLVGIINSALFVCRSCSVGTWKDQRSLWGVTNWRRISEDPDFQIRGDSPFGPIQLHAEEPAPMWPDIVVIAVLQGIQNSYPQGTRVSEDSSPPQNKYSPNHDYIGNVLVSSFGLSIIWEEIMPAKWKKIQAQSRKERAPDQPIM